MGWVTYITEQRYEWIKILFGNDKKNEEPKDKPCRIAAACMMCRKTCNVRRAPFGGK